MVDLTSTSVPAWARSPGGETAPPAGGAAYLLVGVGSGQAVVRHWARGLINAALLIADDADVAAARLQKALDSVRVGVRVAIAGPVGVCLKLRTVAIAAGAEDDEIQFSATESSVIEVFCAHCASSTSAAVGVDDLVPCVGCGRTLIVYYHVSRWLGKYLGFQVDAETLPPSEVRS